MGRWTPSAPWWSPFESHLATLRCEMMNRSRDSVLFLVMLRAAMPKVVVIAGPNGAGKSTAAPAVLRNARQVNEFVNADIIAAGLSAFSPDAVAVTAGRVMLERIRELAREGRDFAFETTLVAGHSRHGSASFRVRGIPSTSYICGCQPLSLPLPGSLSACAAGATQSLRILFDDAMTEASLTSSAFTVDLPTLG